MTRDEILNMPAGREMDALIAKEVMGCNVSVNKHGVPFCMCKDSVHSAHSDYREEFPSLDCFSTDISAAIEMAEHLRKELGTCKFYFIVDPKQGNNIRAIFNPLLEDDHFEASADTAPLAICRAALLAVLK